MCVPDTASNRYKEERAKVMTVDPALIAYVKLETQKRGIPLESLADHQYDRLATSMDTPGLMDASEQGTGKTRSLLAEVMMYDIPRTLVICTASGIDEWEQEPDRWFHSGSKLPTGHNVWACNNMSVKDRKLATGILAHEPGKHILVINHEVVHDMMHAIEMFNPVMTVVDEGWKIKSKDSRVTKACLTIGKWCKIKRVLNGTPIGNGVQDLWSQMKFVNNKCLPDDYSLFESRFMINKLMDIHTRSGQRQIKKTIGCQDAGSLMRLLNPHWYRACKALCLNILPKQYSTKYFDLPKSIMEKYRQVDEEGEVALGHELSLNGRAVTMIRLQQITGGFLPQYISVNEDDVECEPFMNLVELPNPKVDFLKKWCKDHIEYDGNTRVIIWCRYNAEISRLVNELKNLCRGQVVGVTAKTKNLTDIKASFNSRDPDGVQVIVAQIDKLCSSHNLQACDYNFIFSHTWSYIKRSQLEDRSHRMGRENGVQYIDLVCRGTIDEEIMEAMAEKRDLAIRFTPHTVNK